MKCKAKGFISHPFFDMMTKFETSHERERSPNGDTLKYRLGSVDVITAPFLAFPPWRDAANQLPFRTANGDTVST